MCLQLKIKNMTIFLCWKDFKDSFIYTKAYLHSIYIIIIISIVAAGDCVHVELQDLLHHHS